MKTAKDVIKLFEADDLSSLTNGQIVKKAEAIQAKMSKMTDRLIAAGHGSVKPSDMRANPGKDPLFGEYLSLADQLADLKSEAVARYGHDLSSISQLRNQKRR